LHLLAGACSALVGFARVLYHELYSGPLWTWVREATAREDWLEGTAKDWERQEAAEPKRPEDGYYGW